MTNDWDGLYLDDHHLDTDQISIWMASKVYLKPKSIYKYAYRQNVSPNGYVVNRSPKSQTMAWGHFPYNPCTDSIGGCIDCVGGAPIQSVLKAPEHQDGKWLWSAPTQSVVPHRSSRWSTDCVGAEGLED